MSGCEDPTFVDQSTSAKVWAAQFQRYHPRKFARNCFDAVNDPSESAAVQLLSTTINIGDCTNKFFKENWNVYQRCVLQFVKARRGTKNIAKIDRTCTCILSLYFEWLWNWLVGVLSETDGTVGSRFIEGKHLLLRYVIFKVRRVCLILFSSSVRQGRQVPWILSTFQTMPVTQHDVCTDILEFGEMEVTITFPSLLQVNQQLCSRQFVNTWLRNERNTRKWIPLSSVLMVALIDLECGASELVALFRK